MKCFALKTPDTTGFYYIPNKCAYNLRNSTNQAQNLCADIFHASLSFGRHFVLVKFSVIITKAQSLVESKKEMVMLD